MLDRKGERDVQFLWDCCYMLCGAPPSPLPKGAHLQHLCDFVHHRYARLLLLSRNKKKGASTSAVNTPTGRTAGAMTTRASRSASIRKIAPPKAETGSSKR